MAGLLCLQGGREFTAACRTMDADVLAAAQATRVAVLAGAARVGSDYDGTSGRAPLLRIARRRGARPFRIHGPTPARPRPRWSTTSTSCVLPGGSPTLLLDVLTGAPRERLLELHAAGTAISGASAGAMVMCSHVVRPDRGDVVDGLDLVDGLALPHWSPGADPRWSVPDVSLWGLPECGGVIVDGGTIRGVGAGMASLHHGDGWQPIPR